jgi:hypothetical protein
VEPALIRARRCRRRCHPVLLRVGLCFTIPDLLTWPRARALAALLAALLAPSVAGTFTGGCVVAAWVVIENVRAAGPYFPPGLIAPFIVLPVTMVLLPFQVFALRYNATAPMSWTLTLLLGAVAGSIAGLVLQHIVLGSSQPTGAAAVVAMFVATIVQGCVTLACSRLLTAGRWVTRDRNDPRPPRPPSP